MKNIKYPDKKKWSKLIQRPTVAQKDLSVLVNSIFNEVQKNGDKAILKYNFLFDKSTAKSFVVTEDTVKNARQEVSKPLQQAIKAAKRNIEKFHSSQKESKKEIETTKGVLCWRENRPIEKVGIYIPGGTAPLFSTVLMLGIPAKIAGCKEVVMCTPPDKNGKIHPAILFAAGLVGITKIYAVGGIQAIGAMTFGTKTIPKVDKLFGPGNQYVTAAKNEAQNFGVSIDMPAGPSEVLVIADRSCKPEFVAADLLSQAEHGADSQVILLSNDETVVEEVLKEVDKQIQFLPRQAFAAQALKNSRAVTLSSINDCILFSNEYAPEHLILAVENYRKIVAQVSNAGSVFLGNYSCESAGDYASGTNHTLPTNGFARNYSGVSLDSFCKKISFQEITVKGIENIGKTVELMAEAERLLAHKNAVSIRLKSLKK